MGLGADGVLTHRSSARTGAMDRGVQPVALNYDKIKRDLSELIGQSEGGNAGHRLAASHSNAAGKAMRRCCLLLQALRWRLTRSRPGRARRWVLHVRAAPPVQSLRHAASSFFLLFFFVFCFCFLLPLLLAPV